MKRLGILGAGHVGDAVAYTAALRGLCQEIFLYDCEPEKALAVATDVNDARYSYPQAVQAYAVELEELASCDIIVVCLGKIPLTGDRLDELSYSKPRIEKTIPLICNAGFSGIFIVISNPVDIIAKLVRDLSGFEAHRVIGTGTALDTCRFNAHLAERFNVDPASISGVVLGEHGNSQFPAWSQSKIGNILVEEYAKLHGQELSDEDKQEIAKNTALRGWLIFSGKKCTQFGIANTTLSIAAAIDRDSKSLILASTLLEGEYGLDNLYLSTPCIIGKEGVVEKLELDLNDAELQQLRSSAELLKKTMQEWEI